MSVKVACPNCLETAIKTGNVIVCEACDATFKITQTGPAKVKDIGQIEDLQKRVKALEDAQGSQPAADGDNGDGDNGDDELDIVPR